MVDRRRSAIAAVTVVLLAASAHAQGPQQCVKAVSFGDCKVTGQFVCIGTFLEGNTFGFCQETADAKAPWQCCRLKPADAPNPPAPPRIAPSYPLPPTKRPTSKPNIVLFLTDDEDYRLQSLAVMNTTKELLIKGGTFFENYRVVLPICCPSRVSILSGRYPHNSGAMSNTPAGWCSVGKYWKGPGQNVSLPTYIRKAGYTTGIFGKELNVNDDTYISPGWDRFFVLGGTSEGHYYADWFNDQGQRYNAKPSEYMTDLISNRAQTFIEGALQAGKPFFAYVAPHAPHTRASPQPGTDGYFKDWKAPRTPSWNLSSPDKHWLVRVQKPLTPRCALGSDSLYQNRLRALLGVDQMIQDIVHLIMKHNQLDNTYILYTSDHGFHLGEFQMPYFKGQPYETDLRVPFMIRGPGIAPGRVLPSFAAEIDLAPTIAELAGTKPPPEAVVDGHSLVPLLFSGDNATAAAWRSDLLFEFFAGGHLGQPAVDGPYCRHPIMSWNNTYAGVVTTDGFKYVEFNDTESFVEMYDLNADPWEISNLAKDAAHAAKRAELQAKLGKLRNCAQDTCWSP